MKRSIATVSLSGTLPEKLTAAAAAGFDGIEIFESDLLYHQGSPRDLRRQATDLGLEMLLFQPFRDFEAAPRAKFARNLDRAARKLDLMTELGTQTMLVCSTVAPDAINDPALMAEDLHKLAEMAQSRGLQIGYEALAWGTHINRWRQSWKIAQQADHPNLSLILDSFHVLSLADTTTGFTPEMAAKTCFVQIADAPLLRMDVIEWSRHFRLFPGQGDLDVAGFLAPLLQAGYQGPLSLEIFNDGFRAAPPRQTAEDGARSLHFLEDTTRRRLQNTPTAAPLFAAPAAPTYQAWEFLEFAVDQETGDRLAATWRALGFRNIGRHTSKNVELYRQGHINLVLNREPDSFAHAYFLMHGASVCATGLAVENAETALARAQAYQCRVVPGGAGPNQSAIPGVIAPDGSLYHFVDPTMPDVYRTDFIMDHHIPPTAHLNHIDHVSLGIPDGQFGTWILFLKAALGFTADDEFVLPDPYGLIKSRVLRSENANVRLPLNISESANTAIARSLSSYGGAGVQHIAFATDDIFAAQRAITAAGTQILQIPANYYDDLAAKFALSDDVVATLASANLLFDREATGGEFLHCYTEAFEDRFVFEIVERRGYHQYGAANAAVRLAALAQKQQRRPYSFNALEF